MTDSDGPSKSTAPPVDDPDATALFPGRNPNPVFRIRDRRLLYANPASDPICETLGLAVGEEVPEAWLGRLLAAAEQEPPAAIEVTVGIRTFSLLAVPIPEHQFINVYGTDVTAEKVVDKFPDRNPNPVLRMTDDGRLLYANAASEPITSALGLRVGEPLPPALHEAIVEALEPGREPIQVSGEGRTFILRPVAIPEFGFTNIYGTDVTAARALNTFPDENPNPVLRVSRDGRLEYANPASELVRRGLEIAVGEPLSGALLQRLGRHASDVRAGPLEVEVEGRIFELRVVSLFEYGSINLYGTDVTAERAIELALQQNEELLLNILPVSIAARLRGGEKIIADRFDEMTVLFADVVNFTGWSSTAEPVTVVSVLNEVFSLFDRLVDSYGLEKIKTIGDAYMIAGGTDPTTSGDAARAAGMALDMLDALAAYRANGGYDLHVRIGLHTGPVVAGVIGLKKFIYDVWGDTVNVASRLEASSLPDRTHVTAETARRLGEQFVFERRGTVELKGKGAIETSFLVGRA